MTVINSQCSRCARQFAGRLACEAFPAGIPREIVWNERLHLEVIPGQSGTTTYKADGLVPEYVPTQAATEGGPSGET